jgi:hypothetical protein
VIFNPSKVTDWVTFRRHVEYELRTRGWERTLWLETTVDDPGRAMTKQAVGEGVDVGAAGLEWGVGGGVSATWQAPTPKNPKSNIDAQLVRSNTQRPRMASNAGTARISAAPAIRTATAAAGVHPASKSPLAKEPERPKAAEDARAIQTPASCPWGTDALRRSAFAAAGSG